MLIPPTKKILILDPLSLRGQEIVSALVDEGLDANGLEAYHSADNKEHQITDIAGESKLVPHLTNPDDLEGCSAVILASEVDSDPLDHVEVFLDRHPEALVIDAARLPRLFDRTLPTAAALTSSPPTRHLRVAHPCLVTACLVVNPLLHLKPSTLSVFALESASTFGNAGIETLARQTVARLQGATIGQDLVAGEILAFNLVAFGEDMILKGEAAHLMPDLNVTVSRAITGTFHGHLAYLSVSFDEPVTESQLIDSWRLNPSLTIADLPMHLNDVASSDLVAMTPPCLSADRRTVALTTMVDGLRHGGSLTTIEILFSLL